MGAAARSGNSCQNASMRFALTIPAYRDPGSRDPYEKTYELCRVAEQAGFDAGFMGHHSFTPGFGDAAAPFVLLAAIAARTERLRLGTGIFLLPLHHPVAIAEQVAVLDSISNGRAILGVGIGYRPYEYEGFGVPFRRRGRIMDEALELIRSAWTTGSFAYEGRHFQVPDLPVQPRPVQEPHPRHLERRSEDYSAPISSEGSLGLQPSNGLNRPRSPVFPMCDSIWSKSQLPDDIVLISRNWKTLSIPVFLIVVGLAVSVVVLLRQSGISAPVAPAVARVEVVSGSTSARAGFPGTNRLETLLRGVQPGIAEFSQTPPGPQVSAVQQLASSHWESAVHRTATVASPRAAVMSRPAPSPSTRVSVGLSP